MSCALIANERLLMTSIVLMMSVLGLTAGTIIKFRRPEYKKILLFFSALFTLFLLVSILILWLVLDKLDVYTIALAIAGSILVSAAISLIRWRK